MSVTRELIIVTHWQTVLILMGHTHVNVVLDTLVLAGPAAVSKVYHKVENLFAQSFIILYNCIYLSVLDLKQFLQRWQVQCSLVFQMRVFGT